MSELLLKKKKKKRKKLLDTFRVRGEEEEEEIITGPLGIWFFPILNVILKFIKRLRQLRYTPTKPKRRLKVYQFVRDEKGRIIEILEHEA